VNRLTSQVDPLAVAKLLSSFVRTGKFEMLHCRTGGSETKAVADSLKCNGIATGVRVVGFDNGRGKGDHCHIQGVERRYTFVSVEHRVEDFIAAFDAARDKT